MSSFCYYLDTQNGNNLIIKKIYNPSETTMENGVGIDLIFF